MVADQDQKDGALRRRFMLGMGVGLGLLLALQALTLVVLPALR